MCGINFSMMWTMFKLRKAKITLQKMEKTGLLSCNESMLMQTAKTEVKNSKDVQSDARLWKSSNL